MYALLSHNKHVLCKTHVTLYTFYSFYGLCQTKAKLVTDKGDVMHMCISTKNHHRNINCKS